MQPVLGVSQLESQNCVHETDYDGGEGEVGWLASCSSDSPTTEDETQLTLEEQMAVVRTLPLPREQDYDNDVDETASERSSSQVGSLLHSLVDLLEFQNYEVNRIDEYLFLIS